MGVSILVGGITTFLAAVPLAFSSAYIFKTVFYCFFAIVSLGVTHGLVLLPVLLSYFGPTDSVFGHSIASNSAELSENDSPQLTPRTANGDNVSHASSEES